MSQNIITGNESWNKIFPKSSQLDHRRITFKNRYAITLEHFPKSGNRFSDKKCGKNKKLEHFSEPNEVKNALAGDLYLPKNSNGKFTAVAICSPFGAVKEQVSDLYAQTIAEHGFITLAFAPSYTGESSGEPRHVASPDINIEDFSTAVDKRIKAVATSTMYDMTRVMSRGYNDTITSQQRTQILEQLSQQRWQDAENGTPAYQSPSLDLKGDEAQFIVEYADYYRTTRGYHPRAVNSGNAWTIPPLAFMNWPILSQIQEIAPPLFCSSMVKRRIHAISVKILMQQRRNQKN